MYTVIMDIQVIVWSLVLPVIIIIGLVAIFVLFKYLRSSESEEEILPYKAKQFLFSRSEHEFMRILNEQLDSSRFLIFPKVRLADFVEVTAPKDEYQKWWNKIKSKHVDFLIWDIQNNKIKLAIELDGKSHESDKVRERDDFVNKMYAQIGVSIKRVEVGSDFEVAAKDIELSLSEE